MKGYINIYRSGFFHREGKPGTMDRHGGDLYPTAEAAMANIHPITHYVDTVEVEWADVPLRVNAKDSVPIPLRVSRKAYFKAHEDEESVHV